MGKVLGNQNQNKKGGGNRHKWSQILLSPDVHKRLRQIALDKDCTLALLLRHIVENYINTEDSHGRTSTARSTRGQAKKG